MYKQDDEKWANMPLGKSGLKMRTFGCVVTDIAIAFGLVGYKITPGEICEKLNEIKGFTPEGLVVWAKVSEAYPQFKFGEGQFAFRQGVYGKFAHWLLEIGGHYYDSISGTEQMPQGWRATGRARFAEIRPPENIEIAETEPEPSNDQERTYTVKAGDSLWKIAELFYNEGKEWKRIWEANSQKIADPNLIHPGLELVIPDNG